MYQMFDFNSYMTCYYNDDDPVMFQSPHPFAFTAKACNGNTPNYREAMESPDREGFIIAMQSEYDSLNDLEALNAVPRSVPSKPRSISLVAHGHSKESNIQMEN